MITISKQDYTRNDTNKNTIMVELRGLSLDDKPTTIDDVNIANGSTFIEIDTGKIYMYDLQNTQWLELGADNSSLVNQTNEDDLA